MYCLAMEILCLIGLMALQAHSKTNFSKVMIWRYIIKYSTQRSVLVFLAWLVRSLSLHFFHFSGCYCSNLISSVGKFGCFVAILIVESLSLLVLFGSVLTKSFGLIIRLVNQVGGDMLQCCSISILLLKSNLCSWFGFFVDWLRRIKSSRGLKPWTNSPG